MSEEIKAIDKYYLEQNGLVTLWNKILKLFKTKQKKLVSGTNIKTIESQSILGAGNIVLDHYTKSETDAKINNAKDELAGTDDILSAQIDAAKSDLQEQISKVESDSKNRDVALAVEIESVENDSKNRDSTLEQSIATLTTDVDSKIDDLNTKIDNIDTSGGLTSLNATATATTTDAGTEATATVSKDSNTLNFNFTIPKGDKGDKGDAGTSGDVTELNFTADASQLIAGAQPTASVTQEGTNVKFSFGIPKGADGGSSGSTANVEYTYKVYIYTTNSTATKPEDTTNSIEYDTSVWQDYPDDATEQWYQCIGTVTVSNNTITSVVWSNVIPLNGARGTDGSYTEFRFQVVEKGITPTWNTTLSSMRAPTNWTTSPPTKSSTQNMWMITAKITAEEKLDGTWSTPVQISGEDGTAGLAGRIPYPAGYYTEGLTYESTENAVPYVYNIEDQSYYICTAAAGETWTASSNNLVEDTYNGKEYTAFWEKITSFKFLITDLIIADNGTVGSAVFNGDYMFSKQGAFISDGNFTSSSAYENFDPEYPDGNGGNNWRPSLLFNLNDGTGWFSLGDTKITQYGVEGTCLFTPKIVAYSDSTMAIVMPKTGLTESSITLGFDYFQRTTDTTVDKGTIYNILNGTGLSTTLSLPYNYIGIHTDYPTTWGEYIKTLKITDEQVKLIKYTDDTTQEATEVNDSVTYDFTTTSFITDSELPVYHKFRVFNNNIECDLHTEDVANWGTVHDNTQSNYNFYAIESNDASGYDLQGITISFWVDLIYVDKGITSYNSKVNSGYPNTAFCVLVHNYNIITKTKS